MYDKKYLKVYPLQGGMNYSNFSVYLPCGERYYAEYRFVYMNSPVKAALGFSGGANDNANCEFFRIREAYVGVLDGESFSPLFRALQGGEVGFAFCEKGAGDFSGGFHGDEVMTEVSLSADGRTLSLDTPCFCSFNSLTFKENSYMYRCNTPDCKLVYHKQVYTVSGDTLRLLQYIEWIGDAKPLVAAYSPMLTVQRINPADTKRILTDTVELYEKEGGRLLKTIDTTEYGDSLDGKFSVSPESGMVARAVKVYGKDSGFGADCGYTVLNGSIPESNIDTHLCVRFSKCLDNKIYFNIGKDSAPAKGTVWESDIYYRLNYAPNED